MYLYVSLCIYIYIYIHTYITTMPERKIGTARPLMRYSAMMSSILVPNSFEQHIVYSIWYGLYHIVVHVVLIYTHGCIYIYIYTHTYIYIYIYVYSVRYNTQCVNMHITIRYIYIYIADSNGVLSSSSISYSLTLSLTGARQPECCIGGELARVACNVQCISLVHVTLDVISNEGYTIYPSNTNHTCQRGEYAYTTDTRYMQSSIQQILRVAYSIHSLTHSQVPDSQKAAQAASWSAQLVVYRV